MLLHTTKNDLYAELIELGHENGYKVIAEFCVDINQGNQTKIRKKTIDLVWAKQRKPSRQASKWQEHWKLIATFEIEACDVRNIDNKEFNRHIKDLPRITNDCGGIINHYIVLYTSAYDRNWNHKRNIQKDIDIRKKWAENSGVTVLDGRDLSVLFKL